MFFAGLVSALLAIPFATAQLSELEKHVDTLDLGGSFNYVMPAYWTSLPRHRRTPFAVCNPLISLPFGLIQCLYT